MSLRCRYHREIGARSNPCGQHASIQRPFSVHSKTFVTTACASFDFRLSQVVRERFLAAPPPPEDSVACSPCQLPPSRLWELQHDRGLNFGAAREKMESFGGSGYAKNKLPAFYRSYADRSSRGMPGGMRARVRARDVHHSSVRSADRVTAPLLPEYLTVMAHYGATTSNVIFYRPNGIRASLHIADFREQYMWVDLGAAEALWNAGYERAGTTCVHGPVCAAVFEIATTVTLACSPVIWAQSTDRACEPLCAPCGQNCKSAATCTYGKRHRVRCFLTGPVLPRWAILEQFFTKDKIKVRTQCSIVADVLELLGTRASLEAPSQDSCSFASSAQIVRLVIDEKRAVGIELPKDAYNKLEKEPTADPADVPDGLLDTRPEVMAVETVDVAGGGGGADEADSDDEEEEESEEEESEEEEEVEEESNGGSLGSNDFA